jgi:hypothetical protein
MTDFATLCDQRRRRLALNIPPARFNVISPYIGTNYTQFDLDMRRKAEILKYSSNKMSTQTNSLTKKQRWSQISRGNFTQPSISVVDPSSTDLTGAICPDDDMIPMSTHKSGVPGRQMFLYLNKSIPLYNYATANRTYPFNIQTDYQFWRIATKEDALLPHNNEKEFFTLSINNNIDQPFYVYSVTFPVGLLVTGTILQNNIPKTQPVTLSIFSITATIYYSNKTVRTINVPVTLQTLVFNVAGKTGTFSAVQYVGNITMSSIRLTTEPGYIYDFKLMFRINITGGGSNYFSNIQSFAYANLSSLNNIIQNCVVTSLPATTKNEGFKIVGA